MLHKTRGIVFHVTDYSESSVVAKIYTELFGLQSYLVNSVRKKNPKIKPVTFQPLALIDLVVYHKERMGLQRLAEVKINPPLKKIPFDIRKSSIVLFMNEVLYKSVKEEESNRSLFGFIYNSVQLLDMQDDTCSDFHLVFLVQLAKYLGFYPRENFSASASVFNLQDGFFQEKVPDHPHFISHPLSEYFYLLLKSSLNFTDDLKIPYQYKRQLIEKLLEYFQLHVSGFGNIKSHKVLEEVWS
ncbi:MAG: DNA repair protein RecO [Bacteroidetes bacterium]|nr:DNA repair protein RecO [Bacteroidota bacterium]